MVYFAPHLLIKMCISVKRTILKAKRFFFSFIKAICELGMSHRINNENLTGFCQAIKI